MINVEEQKIDVNEMAKTGEVSEENVKTVVNLFDQIKNYVSVTDAIALAAAGKRVYSICKKNHEKTGHMTCPQSKMVEICREELGDRVLGIRFDEGPGVAAADIVGMFITTKEVAKPIQQVIKTILGG